MREMHLHRKPLPAERMLGLRVKVDVQKIVESRTRWQRHIVHNAADAFTANIHSDAMTIVLVQELIHRRVVEVERVAGRRWRASSIPRGVPTEVYRALAVARRALAELPVLAVVHIIKVEIIPALRPSEPG